MSDDLWFRSTFYVSWRQKVYIMSKFLVFTETINNKTIIKKFVLPSGKTIQLATRRKDNLSIRVLKSLRTSGYS